MVNKYYQEAKEKFQNKHGTDIKIFRKKKKKKSINTIMIEIRIF